jgi:2TM domain
MNCGSHVRCIHANPTTRNNDVIDRTFDEARTRARALRTLYLHAAVSVVVLGGVAIVNLVTTHGFWWVIWPMIGWAIALGAHAVAVFFRHSLLHSAWEERKARTMMGRGRDRS